MSDNILIPISGGTALMRAKQNATDNTYYQAVQIWDSTYSNVLAPDASGRLVVTQGGTWTLATNADAAIGAGTAPAKSLIVGGVYNSSAPAPSNGQTVGLQVNSAGSLKVDGSAVTQPVSGTFWQATQPVSGTFWQTTQPVSDAASDPAFIAPGSTTAPAAGVAVLGVTVDPTPAYDVLPLTRAGRSLAMTAISASDTDTIGTLLAKHEETNYLLRRILLQLSLISGEGDGEELDI